MLPPFFILEKIFKPLMSDQPRGGVWSDRVLDFIFSVDSLILFRFNYSLNIFDSRIPNDQIKLKGCTICWYHPMAED